MSTMAPVIPNTSSSSSSGPSGSASHHNLHHHHHLHHQHQHHHRSAVHSDFLFASSSNNFPAVFSYDDQSLVMGGDEEQQQQQQSSQEVPFETIARYSTQGEQEFVGDSNSCQEDDPMMRRDSRSECIHSGQFMISEIDESEAANRVDEDAVCGEKSDTEDLGPRTSGKEVEIDKVCEETPEEFTYGPINEQKTVTIDTSLSRLLQCMSLAYEGKLTSPKWKSFKGLKFKLKDKIRLNNVIWRCWHMQYITNKKPPVCQFATMTDVHNKPEAVLLEGKYWRRGQNAVKNEYLKWRMGYPHADGSSVGSLNVASAAGRKKRMSLQWSRSVSEYGSDSSFSPNDFRNSTAMDSFCIDDELMDDLNSDNSSLFSLLAPGFGFPSTREIAKAGFGADLIQPSLSQLQPPFNDFWNDDFFPMSRSVSILPTLAEEPVVQDPTSAVVSATIRSVANLEQENSTTCARATDMSSQQDIQHFRSNYQSSPGMAVAPASEMLSMDYDPTPSSPMAGTSQSTLASSLVSSKNNSKYATSYTPAAGLASNCSPNELQLVLRPKQQQQRSNNTGNQTQIVQPEMIGPSGAYEVCQVTSMEAMQSHQHQQLEHQQQQLQQQLAERQQFASFAIPQSHSVFKSPSQLSRTLHQPSSSPSHLCSSSSSSTSNSSPSHSHSVSSSPHHTTNHSSHILSRSGLSSTPIRKFLSSCSNSTDSNSSSSSSGSKITTTRIPFERSSSLPIYSKPQHQLVPDYSFAAASSSSSAANPVSLAAPVVPSYQVVVPSAAVVAAAAPAASTLNTNSTPASVRSRDHTSSTNSLIAQLLSNSNPTMRSVVIMDSNMSNQQQQQQQQQQQSAAAAAYQSSNLQRQQQHMHLFSPGQQQQQQQLHQHQLQHHHHQQQQHQQQHSSSLSRSHSFSPVSTAVANITSAIAAATYNNNHHHHRDNNNYVPNNSLSQSTSSIFADINSSSSKGVNLGSSGVTGAGSGSHPQLHHLHDQQQQHHHHSQHQQQQQHQHQHQHVHHRLHRLGSGPSSSSSASLSSIASSRHSRHLSAGGYADDLQAYPSSLSSSKSRVDSGPVRKISSPARICSNHPSATATTTASPTANNNNNTSSLGTIPHSMSNGFLKDSGSPRSPTPIKSVLLHNLQTTTPISRSSSPLLMHGSSISAAANASSSSSSATAAAAGSASASSAASGLMIVKRPEDKKRYKEHRRVCHINAEQKRRCNIKNGFDTLRQILPTLSQNTSSKISKAAMLQKAAEHIRQLKIEEQQKKAECESMRQDIDQYNQAIRACQSQLPATGAPVSCHDSGRTKEMFEQYVRQRTQENWKFYIFSMVMEPMLDSFDASTSTGNVNELCKTTMKWLDQNCSLVTLRRDVLNSLRTLSTTTNILTNPAILPEECLRAVLRTSSFQSTSSSSNGEE